MKLISGILVLLIVFIIFDFMIMWKASATAIRIKSGEYDEAYKKVRSSAILTGILLVLAIAAVAGLLYLKFSPQTRGAMLASELFGR